MFFSFMFAYGASSNGVNVTTATSPPLTAVVVVLVVVDTAEAPASFLTRIPLPARTCALASALANSATPAPSMSHVGFIIVLL
jgi:hypothetical protein